MIVLNLKNYRESMDFCAELSRAASVVSKETGVRVIVCPPPTHLRVALESSAEVFAQHVDPFEAGAMTGFCIPEGLKLAGAKGSLVNHSEHRIGMDNVSKAVGLLQANQLEALVCGESAEECASLAQFRPDYIAVEPPELIGSGISVSTAQPEIITSTVEAVAAVNKEIPILCGAGVSKKEDIAKSVELGAKGVLLASAYVKSKEREEFLRDFASAF